MMSRSCRCLHLAIRLSGSCDILQLLLDRGASVDSVNDEGCTPLFDAIKNNNFHGASILIKQGFLHFYYNTVPTFFVGFVSSAEKYQKVCLTIHMFHCKFERCDWLTNEPIQKKTCFGHEDWVAAMVYRRSELNVVSNFHHHL